MSDGLVAGGTVRITRNGADPVGQVTSPADGSRVGTRELLAGDYTASDEAGNSVEFTVEAAHDLAVLPVQGASATSAVQVHRLGGGCVDVIPESRAESPARASKPRARKPAAKKKAAKA